MTVSSLSPYSFAWNNYVFGNGSWHSIQDVQGLTALPSIRSQDDNAGYQDGTFSGNDFLSARTVIITILTIGGNGNTAQQNFNLLRSALLIQRAGTTPLQFQLSPDKPLQRVNARVRGHMTSLNPDYTYGQIISQWTFYCPDPKIYNDTLMTSTLSVSNPLGRSYNRVYPLLFGGGSANTTYALVVNVGDWDSWPVITLNGPVVNPTLGNFTTGKFITLNGTFLASDVIVIDLASKTITLNGASARNLVAGPSTWFNAPAGSSQFYLTGTGMVVGQTVATVAYRSAYI